MHSVINVIGTQCAYTLLDKNLMVQRSTHFVFTCNVLYINVNGDAENKWREKGFNVNILCMGFSKVGEIILYNDVQICNNIILIKCYNNEQLVRIFKPSIS